MLTPEQRADFDELGFVRLPGAFSRADAAAMESRLWAALGAKYGARRDDSATWAVPQTAGLQALKRDRVFAAIGGPVTLAALNELLGPERWLKPRHWGQFLVSFPCGEKSWAVPHHVWHTDFDFLARSAPLRGALVFSFVSEVPARHGGTTVVAGSHRVIARFLEKRPHLRQAKMKVVRKALLQSDAWFKALGTEAGEPDRSERFTHAGYEIAGIPVRVADLTGEPGDMIL